MILRRQLIQWEDIFLITNLVTNKITHYLNMDVSDVPIINKSTSHSVITAIKKGRQGMSLVVPGF